MVEPRTSLEGRKILVVEDDYLEALALSSLLEEVGASVVGPIGWAQEALSLVEQGEQRVDAAILDVDLHGERSYAIADALALRHIGFIFTTGYGADAVDRRYRDHPRCQKPFDSRMLLKALSALE
ncbi:response regulator [Trinickia sp. LjRoot230]|uniref:response regulator n=1 Tax=Trinickia sp. LjRoot230 TaxID=3342288 RepID=UPI003ED065BC